MRVMATGLLAACLPALAWAAPAADAITGIWLNSEGSGYIQIYEAEKGRYAGRVVGATDGDVRDDTKNPDPAKRGESLLGQRVMHGFTFNGEGRWEQGRIYDPDNGETYDAWIALKSPDKLEVHGYILFSLIGRSEIWTRAGPNAEGVMEKALVE